MTLIPNKISDWFVGFIPTGFRGAVSQKFATAQAASHLFAQLLGQLGPEELLRRLNLVRNFAADGRIAPPELTFGISLGYCSDGEGKTIATITPSTETRKQGHPQVATAFYEPRNFLSLLLGDQQTLQPGKTREATLFVFSVPSSAEGFNDRVRALKRAVPTERRAIFAADIIAPLSGIVVPRDDQKDNSQRRYAVTTVPLGAALRQVKGELTAIFDKQALAPGELAATLAAAWFGQPTGDPLRGGSDTILWRAAPLDSGPTKDRFLGAGESFAYFYLELNVDPEGRKVQNLLELNIDLRLHLRLVRNPTGRDMLYAQLLARVRDNAPGRVGIMQRRLRDAGCNVVVPIAGDNNIVSAHYAFQPGGPNPESFGHFPVLGNAALLVNGLASTISRPRRDGDVYIGRERGDVPFLFQLGDGQSGGIQHLALRGKGSAGKNTLANMIAAEEAGVQQVAFCLNPSADEAFPRLCYRWGPRDRPVRSLDNYQEDGKLQPGIHPIFQHGTDGEDGIREWVMNFITPRGRNLEAVLREDVVPAVTEFLDSIDLRKDFPISIRPCPGCNPALAAATLNLVWTGVDPWGETQAVGLGQRWSEFAGPQDHMVLQISDMYKLPEHRPQDPKDLASMFGQAFRRMVFDATSGAHKDNVHVIANSQTWDDFNVIPGGLDRFHLILDIAPTGGSEGEGGRRYLVRVYDPDHKDEVLAELDGTIDDADLRRLLTRREKN